MIKKILIVGGTGMLGRPVVRRLYNDGYKIRLMTHNLDRAKRYFGDEIEKVVADVTDMETLPTAIKGCDAVYINLNAKMNIDKYKSIEIEGTENIALAAADLGIQRIAMISSLNVNDLDAKYRFIDAKLKAERALVKSGIPYTIFRCSWFYESLPLFIQGKKAILLGSQPHPISWLAASDYAGMVSKAFELEGTTGKIYMVKGREKMSIGDALAKFCDLVVPDAAISPIPLWLASVGGLFSRKKQTKGLIQFMKYYDTHPEPDIDGNAEEILGIATTNLMDWAEEYKNRLQLIRL
ncbi:MAG TPA: NAD-dependent epimerase/dehydratase family protein [candidate division Zixibacteria bacterium]|nr:NAD-dependent epimerase/dehydratase family protein [candidate division Zixibacteria bacterium]